MGFSNACYLVHISRTSWEIFLGVTYARIHTVASGIPVTYSASLK